MKGIKPYQFDVMSILSYMYYNAFTCLPMIHSRTKYILTVTITSGNMFLEAKIRYPIDTNKQLADILTQALAEDLYAISPSVMCPRGSVRIYF